MAVGTGWRASRRRVAEAGDDRGGWDRRPGWGPWAGAAQAGLVFALPLLVCVVPYARYLHTHTGEWQLTAKSQDASIEAWHAVARGDREARDRVLYALDETGLRFEDERAPLTTLARRDPAGYGRIVVTNVTMLGKDLAGWWLLPLPLWALAAWVAVRRRRRARRRRSWPRWGRCRSSTALAFFVQPRYLVVTAAMACVLVGVGVATLGRRWRRVALAGALGLSAGRVPRHVRRSGRVVAPDRPHRPAGRGRVDRGADRSGRPPHDPQLRGRALRPAGGGGGPVHRPRRHRRPGPPLRRAVPGGRRDERPPGATPAAAPAGRPSRCEGCSWSTRRAPRAARRGCSPSCPRRGGRRRRRRRSASWATEADPGVRSRARPPRRQTQPSHPVASRKAVIRPIAAPCNVSRSTEWATKASSSSTHT